MSPKPRRSRELVQLRERFRAIVDWCFDENLSLAARVLEMPVSTVQKHYQQGPRRLSAHVVRRIDQLVDGLGQWLLGHGPPDPTGREPQHTLQVTPGFLLTVNSQGVTYFVPNVVKWRVSQVLSQMAKRTDKPIEELVPVLFAPVIEGLKAGLYIDHGRVDDDWIRLPLSVAGRRIDETIKDFDDLKSFLGYGPERVRQIHALCSFWEAELSIPALPSTKKAKTAKRGKRR